MIVLLFIFYFMIDNEIRPQRFDQGKPRDLFQAAEDLSHALERGKQFSLSLGSRFRSGAQFFGGLAGEIK
jgi:hypothetical protein